MHCFLLVLVWWNLVYIMVRLHPISLLLVGFVLNTIESVLIYYPFYWYKLAKGDVCFGCNSSWVSASAGCVFASVEDRRAMLGVFRINSTVLLILYDIFCGVYLFTSVMFHHWSNVTSCFHVWFPWRPTLSLDVNCVFYT